MVNYSEKAMEDCHYFYIHFTSITSDITGKLFSTCYDDIRINFNNGFEDFELCGQEYIEDSDVFLGSKKRFIDLKVGDAISIRNNPVIITDIDYETITDFNEECERMEMEDMEWFESQ